MVSYSVELCISAPDSNGNKKEISKTQCLCRINLKEELSRTKMEIRLNERNYQNHRKQKNY